MLASDLNNSQFAGAMDPDSVMIARFYKKAVKQQFESEKAGRPIFADVIYCEYYPAGNTLVRMDVPAHESHKQRFAKQWAYYQTTQNEDTGGAGTPLSQWAILSPADVENLRGMKVQTIENIAAMSDGALQTLGMGVAGMSAHVLRARAQAYLGSAQDSALPQAQAAEIAEMKKQLEEMKVLLADKPAPATKKAKRTLSPEHLAALKAGREAKQKAA